MLSVLAIIIILFGLVLVPLPVPFGMFFIVSGLALLVSVNAKARLAVAKLRGKHPRLNRWMYHATQHSPRFLRLILHKTRYRRRAPLNRPRNRNISVG